MASNLDPWESGSRTRLHPEFVSGLRCFNSENYAGAVPLFRAAEEGADLDDIYQSRYTSFHGLARVMMGDRNGVKLCRKAAVGEKDDPEVYHNLAIAEDKLGFSESAFTALRRGLQVDSGHSGLLRLKNEFVLREQKNLARRMRSEGLFNRVIGKLFRRTSKPYPYR
ncbi:MAG: hypothetical protein PVJ66_01200 [Gammaproteobacteria bacterium]|jgi:hypothetical protein